LRTAVRRIVTDLCAPEDVAYRQDEIGDDRNPEGVGADQWDCDEHADDGKNGQNQRNGKNCGGRRRQIHFQPSLSLREIYAFSALAKFSWNLNGSPAKLAPARRLSTKECQEGGAAIQRVGERRAATLTACRPSPRSCRIGGVTAGL